MRIAIIDGYTDEPSGLGVPPYLGTYPRYIYGALNNGENEIYYFTIDDLRYYFLDKRKEINRKTNIKNYNLTRNHENVHEILQGSDEIVVISGINTPGKYLSAVPGSLNEIADFISNYRARKVLTGPAAIVGTRLQGGRFAEKLRLPIFDEINFDYKGINTYDKIMADKGAEILKHIPYPVIVEMETGKGCDVGRCSFCTEPLKNRVKYREVEDVIKEGKELNKYGASMFRFGKATCFYSYGENSYDKIKVLLKEFSKLKPKVLHIDNVNPNKVIFGDGEEITKLVVEYCTEGNIAAFGIESFDINVVKANRLNTSPENALRAIRMINKYGKERGPNGMPKFLPGINLILGLLKETKQSLEINYEYLKKILEEDLLLRRINIRQVVPFEGTLMHEMGGLKYLRKNKSKYWSWRKRIRREIDHEMLKRLVPKGTLLKDVYMETYEGNTTFGRQFGTYPLTVGVKERVDLKKYYDVRVVDWMLRSVVGEVVDKN